MEIQTLFSRISVSTMLLVMMLGLTGCADQPTTYSPAGGVGVGPPPTGPGSGSPRSGSPGKTNALFLGLGDLHGGEYFSNATAVSPEGSVVVGVSKTDLGDEVFLWTPNRSFTSSVVTSGVMTKLNIPYDGGNGPTDVSINGAIVVGYNMTQPFKPFRWSAHGGAIQLSTTGEATGVTPDGGVVVGRNPSFVWNTKDGIVNVSGLTDLANIPVSINDISGDSLTVVGERSDEAFRWSEATGMQMLGYLTAMPGFKSSAIAVSNDGSVIVGKSVYGIPGPLPGTWFPYPHAFRWTQAGGMEDLNCISGQIGSCTSVATGVSADGSVVIGYNTIELLNPSRTENRAFVWDEAHGMRFLSDIINDETNLDITGWQLEEATGISYDGRTVVGSGTNPDGNTEAWIATY